MNDFIKNFLEREREEIEKHKFRIGAALIFAIAAIIFSVSEFGSDDEIILTESPQVEEKISAPVEVKKISEVADKNISPEKKVSDENITPVIGANPGILFVKDPFKIHEVEEIETNPEVVEKNSESEIFSSQIEIPSPPKNSSPILERKFILTGTVISGSHRIAQVKYSEGKNFSDTIILQVGDSLDGKKVVEIAEDCVTLDGGEKIYLD